MLCILNFYGVETCVTEIQLTSKSNVRQMSMIYYIFYIWLCLKFAYSCLCYFATRVNYAHKSFVLLATGWLYTIRLTNLLWSFFCIGVYYHLMDQHILCQLFVVKAPLISRLIVKLVWMEEGLWIPLAVFNNFWKKYVNFIKIKAKAI